MYSLYLLCKFGEYISYSFRDIGFFLGVTFCRALYILILVSL